MVETFLYTFGMLLLVGIVIYILKPYPFFQRKHIDEKLFDPASSTIVAKGNFRDIDKKHKGSGSFEILIKDGKKYLQLRNFKVTKGPNLYVWLSAAKNPTKDKDVSENDFLELSKLKAYGGNQIYPLPADFEANRYNSVVIWCKLFKALFTPADIEKK